MNRAKCNELDCIHRLIAAQKTFTCTKAHQSQSRGYSLQKQARLTLPSSRFPLLAGGTARARSRSPLRSRGEPKD